MRIQEAWLASLGILLASCDGQREPYTRTDPYLPSIREGSSGGTYYRFSETQLEHMKKSRLDRDVFLQYVERQWPPDRLVSYCTPANRWDPNEQNLVRAGMLFDRKEIPVHNGKCLDFDKLYVYVCEDDGKSHYYGDVGTNWKRWKYSLNAFRGADHWVFIGTLPNDLADKPDKYLRP